MHSWNILRVVVAYLNKNQVQRPFILFVDGHTTHLSMAVSKFCREQDIVLVTYYPNATWILQPLDVVFFARVKGMWDAFVLDLDRNLNSKIDTSNIASLLRTFLDARKPDFANHIRSAFKRTGTFPWDVKAIEFQKLPDMCRMRPDVDEEDQIVYVNNWPQGKLTDCLRKKYPEK